MNIRAQPDVHARTSAETVGFGSGVERMQPALQALAWLLVAAALGGTFWLYSRPNLLLDLGSFMLLCGFPQ